MELRILLDPPCCESPKTAGEILIEKTKEYLRRERKHAELCRQDRKDPEYHREAAKLFELGRRL